MHFQDEPALRDLIQKNVHVWINGRLYPAAEAVVSVFDRNVFYGDAAFDTVRLTRDQKVFRIHDHLHRFRVSTQSLAINLPYTDDELLEATARSIKASGTVNDGWIRFSASRGIGSPGLDPRHSSGTPTVTVMAIPFGPHSHNQNGGVRLKIASTRRIPPQCIDSKIKQVNYINSILAKLEAINAGLDDALMLDLNGYIAEATAANIFVYNSGKLFTPGLKNSLGGITRRTVMEIAEKQKIPVVETDLTAVDLYGADEVFLTSTGMDILPVIEVDWHPIGSGSPGPTASRLLELYLERTQQESLSLI